MAVEPMTDATEEVCRICHDNPSRMMLISPCLCKGSMGKVHCACLERWLAESGKVNCEICGHQYETVRRPRYTGIQSIVAWVRHPLTPTDTRNLFFDLACFFILTPLAAVSAWLCVVGAKHYSNEHNQINRHYEAAEMANARLDLQLHRERSHEEAEKLKRIKSMEGSNATWTSIGLLTLTGTLLAAYYVWLFVAVRYHIQVWKEWHARNFIVTISPLNAQRLEQYQHSQSDGIPSGSNGIQIEADRRLAEEVEKRQFEPVPPVAHDITGVTVNEGTEGSEAHKTTDELHAVPPPVQPPGFLPPKRVQDINHVVIPIMEFESRNANPSTCNPTVSNANIDEENQGVLNDESPLKDG